LPGPAGRERSREHVASSALPELPEVETVRCQLEQRLLGMRFCSVERTEAAMLRDCVAADVTATLPGKQILDVDRLGKFIIVRLESDAYLTLHLGMTGQLLVDPPDQSAHTRFLFGLTDDGGSEVALEFRDIRKFGRLHLTKGSGALRLDALGPDAWLGAWDGEYLRARLEKRSAPLKAFLLDQRNLAGIGNIYADEILWWTELSPLRAAGSLSGAQVEALAQEIRRRLAEGVRLLGCTLSDFVDTAGNQGGFQNWLQAYGKQGQVCGRCGGTFARVVVGGRGTSYCPDCQR
jgi:formamidopyrimidine-DNA glycosylase